MPKPSEEQPDSSTWSDSFMEHASICSSQYDRTCRAMATEILKHRRERNEARQQIIDLCQPHPEDVHGKTLPELVEMAALECNCEYERAVQAESERDAARARLAEFSTLHPQDTWTEKDGDVLWWLLPVSEPPYCGTPLDDDFPQYVTHWTRLLIPSEHVEPATEENLVRMERW